MLFDWFKILKNLEEKRGKNQTEIHAILCKYYFQVLYLKILASLQVLFSCFENGIWEYYFTMCFKLYKRKQSVFTFSVEKVKKVFTKLNYAKKVNHADILVKLGQKGFLTEILNQRVIFLVVFPLMLRGNLQL